MKRTTIRDHDLNLEKLAEHLHKMADNIEKHETAVKNVEVKQETEIDEPVFQEITVGMIATRENMVRTEDLYFLHDE